MYVTLNTDVWDTFDALSKRTGVGQSALASKLLESAIDHAWDQLQLFEVEGQQSNIVVVFPWVGKRARK